MFVEEINSLQIDDEKEVSLKYEKKGIHAY
jgi:hypothetical protein